MFFDIYKSLCIEKGLSPNAVAKLLAISSGSVTEWKKGRIPQNSKLKIIAEFFDVSPDYLLGKTDIKNPLPKTEEQIVYSFEGEGSSKQPFDKSKLLSLAELNEAASNLSVEQIKRITDFIKDMNKN